MDQAQEMNNYFHQEGVTANDLPFNKAACDKYGGCPFQKQCKKGAFMPNSTKNGNILGESFGDSSENSLIQKLSSTPPPIMVDVAPPDAPPPSYSRTKKNETLSLPHGGNEKVVSSLQNIQKEISFLISHFQAKGGSKW